MKRVINECGTGNAGAVAFRAAVGVKVFCTGVGLFCVIVGCVEWSRIVYVGWVAETGD